MGLCSSNKLDDEDQHQQYYTATKTQPHHLSQPLSPKHVARNGAIAAQRDHYDEAKQMISAYPSYRSHHPQNSMHSVLSQEPSVATLCEKLELNLSVRNVPKLDLLSPSDPFIVVSLKDEAKNLFLHVGKTEIVWDNPNADFSRDIRLDYLFEQVQHVRLDIYDADEQQTTDLSRHDYIGGAEFIVGDLVTANAQKLVMAIKDKRGRKLKKVKGLQPTVTVRAQEIDDNLDEVQLRFSARALPKMDTFGKIDPFFQMYRKTDDGQWASVYKSEHFASTYTPSWKAFKVETRRLCQGDMHRPILIRCWDWNRDAKPDYACLVDRIFQQEASDVVVRQSFPSWSGFIQSSHLRKSPSIRRGPSQALKMSFQFRLTDSERNQPVVFS